MLQLRTIDAEFIRSKLPYFQDDVREDAIVLNAISDRSMTRRDREEKIMGWLQDYKVLMFFPPENSRQIAGAILDFADRRSRTTLNRDLRLIIGEFERLEEKIVRFVPLNRITKKPRKVTSLTSKALWCCYPYDVPIFDANAQRALRFISRLSTIRPLQDKSEYECFVDTWLQVFEALESDIDLACATGYCYKVRILDRLLWHLGQPSFDSAPDS